MKIRGILSWQSGRGRAVLAAAAALAVVSAAVAFLLPRFRNPPDSGVRFLIGMSQANLVEPWRVTMDQEIREEAKKYPDVSVVFTDAEQSSEKQVRDVGTLMDEGIDLLIISPNESEMLTPVIQKAYQQIPVIVLDRSVEGYDYTLYIGSDNERIGEQAAELMKKMMGNQTVNAVEILGNPMSPQTADRSDGFQRVMQASQNFSLVDTIVGNWISDKAEDDLKAYLKKNPDVNAVFAQNDEMAKGAYRAVSSLNKKRIVIVGVGGMPGENGGLAMVRDGNLTSTFVSKTGGAEAVQYAYDILTHKTGLPKKIILRSDQVTGGNVRQFLSAQGQNTQKPADRQRKIVLGFVQVGDESNWRLENTRSIQNAAKDAGIDLRFIDAQGSQQREIQAISSLIRQKVDVIAFSPLIETGWDSVLEQAKKAGIPIVCMDRSVSVKDNSLFSTFIGSDFVEEGRRAANWLIGYENKTSRLNVVEIRGTVGSTPAMGREEGFNEIIRNHPNYSILALDNGNFTYEGGRKAMENLLNFEKDKINIVFSQNDDMALGAIDAIQARGLVPGKDIAVVSVDGTEKAREAVKHGRLSCTVECNSQLGPLLMKAVQDYANGKELPLRIITSETIFPSGDGAKND